MRAEAQYHVGIVVPSLTAAKAELSDVFGYVWAQEISASVPVRLGSQSTEISMCLVYSVSQPHVELVEQIPGTVWEPADSGIHHVGYWSDDVASDSAELESRGYTHEATGIDGNGDPLWCYYRSPIGPRIELVARAIQSALEAMTSPPDNGRQGA
jgi:Glyoxalase/Bleomycin resistance protein/Dioxygenase superfamily